MWPSPAGGRVKWRRSNFNNAFETTLAGDWRVFALANALNFMDRQILAALAPQLMREFGISAAGYGDVILAFSLSYALADAVGGFAD